MCGGRHDDGHASPGLFIIVCVVTVALRRHDLQVPEQRPDGVVLVAGMDDGRGRGDLADQAIEPQVSGCPSTPSPPWRT